MAVILSSKTIVAIKVQEKGNELLVKILGAGARDWFANAPQVSEGTLMRELLHTDSWLALEKIKNSMADTGTSASAPQRQLLMTHDVLFGYFQSSTLVPSIKAPKATMPGKCQVWACTQKMSK